MSSALLSSFWVAIAGFGPGEPMVRQYNLLQAPSRPHHPSCLAQSTTFFVLLK